MAFKSMAFKRLLPVLVFVLVGFPVAAEPYRVVALGDSLMAGYALAPGESFPEKLEGALRAKGHDVVIANAAVSGDTTSGGLARLNWSVPDGTDLVILGLGANDMLRGVAPDIAERNLDAMIAGLVARDIDVLLAGMLAAPNLGPAYGEAFNGLYPLLARRYGLALYPFLLDGVAAETGLLLEDGMHPNARGVDRMVEGMLPLMEEKLAAREGEAR